MARAPGGGRFVMRCGLCDSRELRQLLDLGMQPLAERMGEGPRYPLAIQQCANCSLVQLCYIPPAAEVFPAGHPYTTGATAALRSHFAALARELSHDLEPGDVVVDIGANDGTLLSYMPEYVRCVAVEPTDQAAKCRAKGFRTWQACFDRGIARDIFKVTGRRAKLITATNVMSHVHEPRDVAAAIGDLLLADGGVFVAENHDVTRITRGLQIDTIYHEHAWYWSPATFCMLLSMYGLDVTDIERVGTHGGSFRTWASPARRDLAARAEAVLGELRSLMSAAEGRVYGVGATTRASTLIHAAQLAGRVSCVAEVEGSEKIGTMMPGTSIPVVPEQVLLDDQPEFALLFAWHLSDHLTGKLIKLGYRGRFIIPLPRPHVTAGRAVSV